MIAAPNLRTLPWVVVVNVDESVDPNPLLTPLDIGEKWTLYAAAQARASRVLIDERIARNVAERMGLTVTGTGEAVRTDPFIQRERCGNASGRDFLQPRSDSSIGDINRRIVVR